MPLFHSPLAMKILIQTTNNKIMKEIEKLVGDTSKLHEIKGLLALLKNPQYSNDSYSQNKQPVPKLYRDEEIEEILKIIWERNQQAESSNPSKRSLEPERSNLTKKQRTEELDLSCNEELDLSCGEELDLSCGEELDLSCGEELDLSCGEELDLSYAEKIDLSYDKGEIDGTSRSSSSLFNPPSEPFTPFTPLKSKDENNPAAFNVGLSQ